MAFKTWQTAYMSFDYVISCDIARVTTLFHSSINVDIFLLISEFN